MINVILGRKFVGYYYCVKKDVINKVISNLDMEDGLYVIYFKIVIFLFNFKYRSIDFIWKFLCYKLNVRWAYYYGIKEIKYGYFW